MLVPCHDHGDVLPWALASLVAQTHDEWECILVDDGSAQPPADIVEAFADPRITLVRLPANHGPAVARQVALERARGDVVALLDADDWMVPARLAAQIECLADSPQVAAVGSGMAVVDASNTLIGLRGCRARRGISRGVRALPPSCGQATVMLRGEVARSGGFDPRLRRAEDADYLRRVLHGREYVVLAAPLYVYREDPRGSAARRIRSHPHRRRSLRKLMRQYPVRATARLLESYAKTAIYAGVSRLGLDEAIVRVRNSPPGEAERRAFEEARAAVQAVLDRVGLRANHAEGHVAHG